MSWEDLRSLLAQHNLKWTERGGFPDCFYHCVRWWLANELGVYETVTSLRKRIAKRLREKYPTGPDPAVFDHVLEEARDAQGIEILNWDEYWDAVVDNLYGGDLEIGAVATLFSTAIGILSFNNRNELHTQFHGLGQRLLYLGFVDHHYRTIDEAVFI